MTIICFLLLLFSCVTILKPCLAEEELETKQHHGYRSYYVLNNNQKEANRPPTRYGIWYPSSSASSYPRGPSYNTPVSNNPPFNPNSVNPSGQNGKQLVLPQLLYQTQNIKLYELIEEAELLESLSGNRRYTIFTPTDKAIEEFLENQSEEFKEEFMSNKEAIQKFLLNHIVPGLIMTTDLEDGIKVNSVGGNILDVIETQEGLSIGGSRLLERENRVNMIAANGVIHNIEDVLFPYKALEGEGDDSEEEKNKAKRLLGVDDDDPELIVDIEPGTIRGINLGKQHRAWLGIPYAKPPIDDLRFAPPERIDEFEDDILSTRKQPNACQQNPDLTFGDFEGATMWNPNTEISEDCLYLNVHAPRNFTGTLPVLVWIYGGGYTTGSATIDIYNPEQYIEKGDLIFVAMQYRVGSHGFLYFGPDTGAPGNVGLMDQIMALEWVQDNIEHFGGDPKQVTIMGESAGSNSVAIHMVSPRSCNLFHRAILQSTGLNPRWGIVDQKTARERSEKLAEEVGCEVGRRFNDYENTLECLKSKESSELLAVEYNVEAYTVNFYPFVAVVDYDVIPAKPERILEAKAFSKDKEVLIGSNANEGFWSLMYYLTDLMPNEELSKKEMTLTREEYLENVQSVFSFYPKMVQNLIAFEYRDLYKGESENHFKALDQMVADSDFVCNTEQFAQALSDNGNKVYRYHYAERSSIDPWPEYSGVKHGDEIEMTFGHPLIQPRRYEGEEVGFAKDLITYWTNFVHNGSPNPSALLRSWPRYKSPSWQYLNLTAAETIVDEKLIAERCEFFNEIVPQVTKTLEKLENGDEDYSDEFESEDENEGDLDICK